jgi:hypothetical protein
VHRLLDSPKQALQFRERPGCNLELRLEVAMLGESTTQVPEILDKFGFDKAEGCA